jgi:hypothetical protein
MSTAVTREQKLLKSIRDARYRKKHYATITQKQRARRAAKRFCPCGRILYAESARQGFKSCRPCRQREKYEKLKSEQTPLGRHVGEFIHERLQETRA